MEIKDQKMQENMKRNCHIKKKKVMSKLILVDDGAQEMEEG